MQFGEAVMSMSCTSQFWIVSLIELSYVAIISHDAFTCVVVDSASFDHHICCVMPDEDSLLILRNVAIIQNEVSVLPRLYP